MSWREIHRHTSFRKGKCAFEVQNRCGYNYQVQPVPTIAYADLPKAYASIGTFTDAHGPDITVNIIAGGVPFTVNGMPYVTFRDSEAEEDGSSAITCTGPQGIYLLVDPADASNVAKGKPAYMIPDATASTGGCLTTAPNGTTNKKFGRFLADASDNITGDNSVNGFPSGTWALVQKLDIF